MQKPKKKQFSVLIFFLKNYDVSLAFVAIHMYVNRNFLLILEVSTWCILKTNTSIGFTWYTHLYHLSFIFYTCFSSLKKSVQALWEKKPVTSFFFILSLCQKPLAGKSYILPVDIRRISTGYLPDIHLISTGYPPRISTGWDPVCGQWASSAASSQWSEHYTSGIC